MRVFLGRGMQNPHSNTSYLDNLQDFPSPFLHRFGEKQKNLQPGFSDIGYRDSEAGHR